MKKSTTLFFAFIFININLHSNYLNFCFFNDKNGIPDWSFTTITFQPYKPIRCLIKLDSNNIGKNNYVIFNIYYVDTKCNEELLNVYRLDIDKSWEWFYYEIYFKSLGDYIVEVSDEKENKLVRKELHLVEY